MEIATKGKQLLVEAPNKPGIGAGLFGALKEAKINCKATTCHEHGETAFFRFVPDDLAAARKALRRLKLKATTEQCLFVEVKNRPGAFADVLQTIADLGIDMKHAYATASTKKSAVIVLMTSADAKVLKKLNA